MSRKSKIMTLGAAAIILAGTAVFFFIEKNASTLPYEEHAGVKIFSQEYDTAINLEPRMATDIAGATDKVMYRPDRIFISSAQDIPFDANMISAEWEQEGEEGTSVEFWMKLQQNDQWSAWQPIEQEVDFKDGMENSGGTATAFIAVNGAEAYQYKFVLHTKDPTRTPKVTNVVVKAFNAEEATKTAQKQGRASQVEDPVLQKLSLENTFEVVARANWGANEDLRVDQNPEPEEEEVTIDTALEDTDKNNEESLESLYPDEFEIEETVTTNDDGEKLLWPIEYAKNIRKIIIHHTASSGDLSDQESVLRAIYYYHAVTKGWGDIGYNYIIGPDGTIYEGRAGGEKVVAGHAAGYNTGSIGIAVIGNYQNDEVPYAVLKSLLAILDEKSQLYDLEPDGTGRFRGEVDKNILGHRDVRSTLCPGQKMYDKLPILREILAASQGTITTATTAQYAFEDVLDRVPLELNPQEKQEVTITLKNTGTETWDNTTQLIINQNANNTGAVTFGDAEIKSGAVATMTETTVVPGETGTFTFMVDAHQTGGFWNFDMTPLFNGRKKTTTYISLPVYINEPDFSYALIKMDTPPSLMKSATEATITVRLRNLGNVTWYKDGDTPIYIGTSSDKDRKSAFFPNSPKRPGILVQDSVAPGGVGDFTMTLKAPTESGVYEEHFTPVIDGVQWLEDTDIAFTVLVPNRTNRAELVTQSTDRTITPGEQKQFSLTVRNIGDKTWKNTGTNALTANVTKNARVKISQIALDAETAPGEEGVITFTVTAPTKPGTYKLYFRPRLGRTNLNVKPLKFELTVTDTTSENGPDIRVRLGTELDAPEITADGSFYIEVNGAKKAKFTGEDTVTVEYVNDTYQLTSGQNAYVYTSYPRFVPDDDSTILEVANWERPSWDGSVEDNRFRGILEIREVDDELAVINELPLEHYLWGLGEIRNSDPIEKIKAVIVSARTYALYYMEKAEKFPGYPYNLDDDPAVSQKYLGYGFELRAPNAREAAEATSGIAVTYNGEIIKTPYFSASDGTYTKSAEEVWGWTNTPWLVSVSDSYCTTSTAFAGHGVGLSGCGAKGAAEAGSTYDEILKHYYTGVALTQQY